MQRHTIRLISSFLTVSFLSLNFGYTYPRVINAKLDSLNIIVEERINTRPRIPADELYVLGLDVLKHMEVWRKEYPGNMGVALLHMGVIMRRVDSVSRASDLLHQCLEISECLPLTKQGALFNNLALIKLDSTKFSQAVMYLEKAAQVYEALGDQDAYLFRKGVTISNRALANKKLRNFPRAIEDYKKSIQVFSQLRSRSKTIVSAKLESTRGLATVYINMADLDNAKQYIEQAFSLSDTLKSSVDSAKAYMINGRFYQVFGSIYTDTSAYKRALVAHQRAFERWREESIKYKVLSLLNIGTNYENIGKKIDALNAYKNAYNLQSKAEIGVPLKLILLVRLVDLGFKQGKEKEAQEYLGEYLDITNKLKKEQLELSDDFEEFGLRRDSNDALNQILLSGMVARENELLYKAALLTSVLLALLLLGGLYILFIGNKSKLQKIRISEQSIEIKRKEIKIKEQEVQAKAQMISVKDRFIQQQSKLHGERLNSLKLGQILKKSNVRHQTGLEIHSKLCTQLAASVRHLDEMEASFSNEDKRVSDAYNKIYVILQKVYKEARDLSHSLQNLDIHTGPNKSLQSLMREICDDFKSEYFQIDLNTLKIGNNDFPILVKENISYILQEALTNVVKHAEAKKVDIQLMLNKLDVDDYKCLNLTIKDDGIGFNTQYFTEGIGIKSIRQYVQELQGSCQIISEPLQGTLIQCLIYVPVSKEDNDY